jgi:hypothetical protein
MRLNGVFVRGRSVRGRRSVRSEDVVSIDEAKGAADEKDLCRY